MDANRDKQIRETLLKNEVGALLLWRPDEIVMATGYLPLWGISVCIYPAVGKPVIYVPELEPADILPADFRIQTYPWGIIECADPWKELYAYLKADLDVLCPGQPVSFIKHIGSSAPPQIAGEGAPLPLDFIDQLMALSEGRYKDLTSEIIGLYARKTSDEIEKIAKANRIAFLGIRAFYEHLIPGKTEVEVACIVETAIQSQIGKDDIFYAKGWPYIMAGVNASFGGIYARNTGKVLQEGELVMIEMAVCVNGYWCDITRTALVGQTINTQQKNIFNAVETAQQMALEMIKPGVQARNVDKKIRDYFQQTEFGAYFNHALGHHVGFRYHDPGMGFNPNSNLVLEEGMVLTVEPGLYVQMLGVGVRIENNIAVTVNGINLLSDYLTTWSLIH
ncbi:MAG: Xaa-Pro peptidase family protein [Candidatus Symbiothrix sp.]|jgi:Xaa-Pro dipeptidase|nr:Xaa-Pro peptidase family protein [Candidatus Symbiothrix sp.]